MRFGDAFFNARTVAESLPLQYVVIGQKQVASQGRPAPTPRQRALVDVIKANADKARFTRGVNTQTVDILRKALAVWDEQLEAIAEVHDAKAALIADLKTRLDGYKVPKAVIVADTLPKTSTGKIQKNVLRDAHAAFYGS